MIDHACTKQTAYTDNFLSNKSEIVTMIQFLIFLYCTSSHATCIIRGYKHVVCGFMAFIYLGRIVCVIYRGSSNCPPKYCEWLCIGIHGVCCYCICTIIGT